MGYPFTTAPPGDVGPFPPVPVTIVRPPAGPAPVVLEGAIIPGAVLRLADLAGRVYCDPDVRVTGLEWPAPVASDTWVINHNLGMRPSVRAFGPGGREMLGEVIHTSGNQSVIYFDGPVSGYAIVSS